jgi:branched-chain amino acid transport system permease protein
MKLFGAFDVRYTQSFAIFRTRVHKILLGLLLLLIVILPQLVGESLLSMVNQIAITCITTVGLMILVGYAGQISLGQSAFMAVGAYTSALLVNLAGFPFLLALPCAGLAAGLVGLVFGVPSLRLKGFYLAMATLAASFIIPWLIIWVRPDITGGVHPGLAVPAPEIFGYSLETEVSMYYLVMAVTCVMVYFAINLMRSRVGRALVAIRDNDLAAAVLGINIFKYKLMAFFICSVYAGVAGSLWGHWQRALNPEHFTLSDSVWYLGMIVVGGLGSIVGAIFGSVYIRVLEHFVTYIAPVLEGMIPEGLAGGYGIYIFVGLGAIAFGLSMVLFLILEPRGINHLWRTSLATWRLHPFSD